MATVRERSSGRRAGADYGIVVATNTFANVPITDADIQSPIFIADRAYRLVAARARCEAGDDGFTITLQKAADGTAMGSGTAMTSALSVAAANQQKALSFALSTTEANLRLAAGDCIGLALSAGTQDTLGGLNVTVFLLPIEDANARLTS